ncbi:MAG: HAMP domain-containing histidine kinase [Lachnospiraceae bacterium]|nr:HAMP domain-containing histidine kinase [Lachnospiraceae bacterium]
MKLFWKQFVGVLAILIAMFTIFGNVMIQTSVQMWLDSEVEASLEEITMFQYAFLTSMEGQPEIYQSEKNMVMGVVKTIEESISSGENSVAVYDAGKNMLYARGRYDNGLLRSKVPKESILWQLTERQGMHYLETLAHVAVGEKDYYLEINKNIQQVYDNRETLLQQYRVAMVILIMVSAILSMALSYGFTSPIRKLSLATKAFARGDYQKRVRPRGNDEITGLMEDFNAMADRLEANIQELNDAVRRQEEFTGAFSHELKTPLTSIIGYSELLMSIQLSEEARMMSAGYIYQDGKRLERLAYKMMELARVDKQDIPFQSISVRDLVEAVKATTRPMLLAKKIELQINIQETGLYGDKDLLLSLLLNIVDNSRKACGEGGHITITGKKTEGGYLLEIQDDGRGMPGQELPHITEAFYMVDKSRARKEGGAGLGMALCAKIVALHQANWQIKSEEGKGTTVDIFLPERSGHEEEAE